MSPQKIIETLWLKIALWFDSERVMNPRDDTDVMAIDWLRVIPLILMHVMAIVGVMIVGWSVLAVLIAILSYLLRMFAITAFYHRYFAHKAFKASRLAQFIFAVLGATATQRGPLWWASHHRTHHRHADTETDPHNARAGFWWSHMGWFMSRKHYATDYSQIPDLVVYPELRWLNRHELVIPIGYALMLYLLGYLLEHNLAPGSVTAGQVVIWAYFVSTVVLLHATLCINSLAHRWGNRRYKNYDQSRNNFILALITLGEGWHNNHHHFPGSARQGFYWWELDISYYVLCIMEKLKLIHGLKSVPAEIRRGKGRYRPAVDGAKHG